MSIKLLRHELLGVVLCLMVTDYIFCQRSANRSANNCDQSGSGARRQAQVPGFQKECQWHLD
jgi:hypothetical protein